MDRTAAYANALATAFAEDLKQPAVAAAVQGGGLTKGQFTAIVNRDVARGLRGESGPALFPNVRAFARSVVDIGAIRRAQRSAGMSAVDMSDIGGISSLAGALAGAVGAIWGAKIQTTAAKQLAQIRLQEAQIVANSQSIAMKSALIQNATAQGLKADPATGQPVDPSTNAPLSEIGQAAQAKIAGIPAWVLGTGAAAAVVGGIFAFSHN